MPKKPPPKAHAATMEPTTKTHANTPKPSRRADADMLPPMTKSQYFMSKARADAPQVIPKGVPHRAYLDW